MKRIILMLVSLISVNLFSLDHGLITGVEAGYNFDNMRKMDNSRIIITEDYSESLYVKLKTGYRIGGFRISGTYTNTMYPIEFDAYNPIQDRFRLDLNYTISGFTIGWFNWCDHKVKTQVDKRVVESNLGQRSIYVSFYKEF